RSVNTGNHDRHDQALAAHRAALQQERAAQAAEEERLQNSAEVKADKRAIKVGVEAWAESMGFDDVSIEPQWNKYAKASGAPPCTATVRVQSGDDTWSFGAGLMNDGSVYVGMAGVEVCDDASLGAALERKAYADWKSNW
ncbi:MAG TPA: hypothetical protein VG123_05095, partial [Streptosporangiaceae bacterium]|nr:hypothetical protein [Streptosporangiaceae bacterium]